MSGKLLTSALLLVVLRISAKAAPMKNCQLSHYKALRSREAGAFKSLRDEYDIVRGPDMNCPMNTSSAHIFLHKEKQKLLEYHRLVLLKEHVDLTIQVLQSISEPSLVGKASGPLETLADIQENLRSCIQLKALNHEAVTPLPRITKLLQKFHTRKNQASAKCLEGAVIFNLLHLLNDVNVASEKNQQAASVTLKD